jgi:hypothetical protein
MSGRFTLYFDRALFYVEGIFPVRAGVLKFRKLRREGRQWTSNSSRKNWI